MRRLPRTAFVAALAALLATTLVSPVSAAPAQPPAAEPAASAALSSGQVQLAFEIGGLESPIGVVNAGDGTNRLFIIEQRGTVRVFNGTSLAAGFFLDLRAVAGGITSGGERGLLGLAFHPDFETNRKLFVNYTNGAGDTVIAELTANAAGTSVPLTSRKVLTDATYGQLVLDQPFSNHNGGQLLFGPDEELYIFTGDGGSAGDPGNRAQTASSKLGKILRISPDLDGTYSVPTDNPFYGGSIGDDLVWATGLRNPWRASFDRSTDDLWIADVGQGSWEEINRGIDNPAGENYGWRCREGKHWYNSAGCDTVAPWPYTDPVAEYGHASGRCSVTGGYVYRGSVFPDFVGQYVLGDYCTGELWTLAAGAGSPSLQYHRDTGALISSFGESEFGELYMTDHAGRLYRVVAPPFDDVASSIHIDSITWLYYQGITGGCGSGDSFCPEASVSREQMASFLVRALKLPSTTKDFFTDDEGSIHEGDINRLAAAGVTGGCTATTFCPGSPVTREQMASFLVRGFDLPFSGVDKFTDDEGSVHENDINSLAAAGITGGCTSTRFCPRGLTTRAEMAAFLKRALT